MRCPARLTCCESRSLRFRFSAWHAARMVVCLTLARRFLVHRFGALPVAAEGTR